jgi:hypothetical protein
VDFNPFVYEFTEIRPVFEISGAPINLVDHDTGCFPGPQQSEHLVPDGTATLSCRLPLFEPLGKREAGSCGMALNRFFLFSEGHASLALAGG